MSKEVYNDEQANIRVVIVGELETNCIIITHKISHELIIIDAGGDVSDIIHHANLNQNQIKHVFATHGHFDHILAVPELSVHYKTHNKRDLNFAIHPSDAEFYRQLELQCQMFGIPVPEATKKALKFLPTANTIEDNQIYKIGSKESQFIECKVISTPGHSEGSCSFLISKNNKPLVLCTGDTLFCGGIGRTDLPGGSYNQIIQSIQNKLYVLDSKLPVIPGHGSLTTLTREIRANPFTMDWSSTTTTSTQKTNSKL